MDNIQKMIVGSLGLVGLIVILVPNSDPLAAKKVEVGQVTAGAPAPVPPPPPLPEQPAQVGNTSGGFVVDDSDIANFGKPMVDPTPPGQRNQQTTYEQTQQQSQQPSNGMAQTQSSPGNYGQQPIVGQNTGSVAGLQPPT
jgi:hypothetical protein